MNDLSAICLMMAPIIGLVLKPVNYEIDLDDWPEPEFNNKYLQQLRKEGFFE